MDLIWIKIAVIVATGTNLFYWVLPFAKLALLNKNGNTHDSDQSVSLIVCIKNGIQHLTSIPTYLKSVNKSDELIVVDDFSTDGTLDALNQINDEKIRIISAKIDQKGKKMALKEGIEHAQNDLLILTDIDCVPRSLDWISHMRYASQNADIVLGYGAYKKRPGFLNAFIRHETLLTVIQYMSYAIAGMPYMGVGRNLAYKKSVFLNSDKFESHNDLASGDDDLFIDSVANSTNTTICIEPDSFTESIPASNLNEFLRQKTRHITTATRYKALTKILLSLYSASHILSYILPIILLCYGAYSFALFALGIRIGVSWIVYALIADKFQEHDLKLSYPLLDFCMFLYYVVLSPFLIFQRNKW